MGRGTNATRPFFARKQGKDRLFEAPERTRGVGGALDELFAVLDLRLEDRSERSLFGPLGGGGLEIDRLVGDFLAGVDVPRGDLLGALDAQQVAAQTAETLKRSRIMLFVYWVCLFVCCVCL